MKKIMFNDRFGLTDAVLEGRKTMTRRVIKQEKVIARHYNPNLFPVDKRDPYAYYRDERGLCRLLDADYNLIVPAYKIGEEVAVAQRYEDLKYRLTAMQRCMINPFGSPRENPGWKNKMFVKADLMPARIRFKSLWIQRLQDISDTDCIAEGVVKTKYRDFPQDMYLPFIGCKDSEVSWTPQGAFQILIDKVSGNGTWDSNPLVWVYEFELIK